jgi:DNA replication and repair protein RecF
MHLEKLSLINFKNYSDISIELHSKVNCFVGDNGVGKTNLLDAVYYLCMCKSYFQTSDQFTVRQGQDYMVLQGSFSSAGQSDELYCGIKTGKLKKFRKNKKEYQRLSDHIGQYPVVMVSPSDSALITEGSEERRKYMNAVIAQFDRNYLENIIQYNKVLAQRNKLLKEMRGYSGATDLLSIYNDQLAPLAKSIYNVRAKFVQELTEVFKKYYALISNAKEVVELEYVSQLNDTSMEILLAKSINKDMAVQHTTVGIHKDDLELKMNGNSIKKIGSQGQQKTFLVSLKLAQFEFLKKIKKIKPVLLLDDIFDKFDVGRVMEILNLVSDKSFGQILITHTNEHRMNELLKSFHGSYSLFRVKDGQVIKVNQ